MNDESSGTPHSLLEQSVAGNAESWTRLCQLYLPMIHGWVEERWQFESNEAEDITQDVAIKVYQKLPQYSREKGKFRGWLYSITKNHVIDVSRRDTPTVMNPAELDLLSAPPWDAAESAVPPRPIVERALTILREHFEEKTWRAAWEVIAEGRSAEDVAAELGMSRGSVYVAKSRVLKKLRTLLGGLEFPDSESDKQQAPESPSDE